jgi:hypothetical protein
VFEEHDGQLVRSRKAISLEVEQAANDQSAEGDSEPPARTHARPVAGRTLIEQLSAASEESDLAVSPEAYLETLAVLVGLIEELNREREGHSRQVAQVCQQLGERIRLDEAQVQGILVSAYLHDVGVSADAHVTPFDVARDPSRREVASRIYAAPTRLFESGSLPQVAAQALRHRFERFDATGFPQGLGGKEIPLGARVLAVAESYVDLTQHEANAFGRRLSAGEALEAIDRHRGTVFDPAVVDWLRPLAPSGARARGVSGSLEEMALPDVIQILANGRKSGRLQVSSGTLHGEMMFQDGSIHDARFGDLQGAEAVYGILRLTQGEFALESDGAPLEDAIGIPTHHLLLEAMRRLDEEQH